MKWIKLIEGSRSGYYPPYKSYEHIAISYPNDTKGINSVLEEISTKDGDLNHSSAPPGHFIYDISVPEKGDSELPAGAYVLATNRSSETQFLQEDSKFASFIDCEDSAIFASLNGDLLAFLENNGLYKQLGIPYKRGYLLYGPPGNGKTNFILSLLNKSLIENAVYIICNDVIPGSPIINQLIDCDNERMKVLIFEEFTTAVNHPSKAVAILNLLDGLSKLDNYITIASTNYPEKIPANLIERPSRFDLIFKVDNPNKEVRTKVLRFYLRREPTVPEIQKTNELSIAMIKEVCIRSQLMKTSVLSEIDRMFQLKELAKKEFAQQNVTKNLGFGAADYEEF